MTTITELMGRMRQRHDRTGSPPRDTRDDWYKFLISDFRGEEESRSRSGSRERNDLRRTGSMTSLRSRASRESMKSNKTTATAPGPGGKKRRKRSAALSEGSSSLAHQYSSVGFRASFTDVSSSGGGGGLKYMLSGQPSNFSFRPIERTPSLEQIDRLTKDHRRGPKQPLQVQTERVAGVKIAAAPAFRRGRRTQMNDMVARLSKPTSTSRGSLGPEECVHRRLEPEEAPAPAPKAKDALQKERDFDHLQKPTLMSKIRGEMTRIFAPDPYGIKTHKWPW